MKTRSNNLFILLSMILMMSSLLVAQGTENGEWRSYGGDIANTRYSGLDEISAENFGDLEVAWRVSTANFGPNPEYNFQSTPLMVDGVLYSTAGSRRSVIALDAGTGELLWMHRLDEGERGAAAPRRLSGRGLAYRDDGADGQIFYVTPGYQLIGLDATSGRRLTDFGTNGVVDLKQNFDQDIDLVTGEAGLHATPLVAGDTIVIGAAHLPGSTPRSMRNIKGYIRGFDALSGDRKWIFHTIPGADDFGNDTWLNDSWRYTGNTGVWGQISVDLELGIAYLPTEMPTNDYYGGHRHGDNLFSDSLIAVDLETGDRLWHYQFIHHDVWDWDLPCAPILADVVIDGVERKIVAQPTKQAWLYVFDRETGEPIWPIEEREVEQSTVPGELLAPTQPFVTRPPAYDRQGVTLDDLIDFTPEIKRRAEAIAERHRLGPIFTPPTVSDPNGVAGTLMLPSQAGGTNWPGGSIDPETGIAYLYTFTTVVSLGLINDPERSDMNFIRGRSREIPAAEVALNVDGIPLVKPPWGRITAIDLKVGEILWQIPHGETPDNIRNHPLLTGVDLPRTGRVGRVGTLVTKTLVIAGEAGTFTTSSGEEGAMLRAYDKATGEEVGAVYMPAGASGSPMTYMHNGQQHIVLAISGGGFAGELIAFRLPG
ncbi:MAG TPA: pyrroloquinoline quinone-dependent dehydrogenase [Gammaproteobacteria bacterium]|nr:pyrroloquinoline quinone-dependent dehydrogenase [Gammaproteobacteria bacterium]